MYGKFCISEGTATDMTNNEVTIYVRLQGEGVPVVRPVPSTRVASDIFVLGRTPQYETGDEDWEFPPGTRVRCELQKYGDDVLLVATAAIETM